MASHLQLHVDLELESSPISGSVASDEHAPCPFHGWLEFASAIEAFRREALTAPAPYIADKFVPPSAGEREELH
jgi:hypothetical protein